MTLLVQMTMQHQASDNTSCNTHQYFNICVRVSVCVRVSPLTSLLDLALVSRSGRRWKSDRAVVRCRAMLPVIVASCSFVGENST